MAERRNVWRGWRLWLTLAIGALLAWQLRQWLVVERSGPDHLVNQVWVERVPRDARDMIGHLVAIEHDGRRVGGVGRGSRWRLVTDGFVWRANGDRMSARFPQTGHRMAVQARTWKCAGQAPKPFDLCLELKTQQRTFRFYSRHDWVIRPHGSSAGELPAELTWLAPALAATLAMPAEEATAVGEEASAAEVTEAADDFTRALTAP